MALAGRGGMVSVAEPAAAVRDRLAAWGGRLSVAAVNGPAATVVSGDPDALAELAAAVRGAGGAGQGAAGGLRLAQRAGGGAPGGDPGRAGRDHPGSGAGPDGLGDDRGVPGRPGGRAPGTGMTACGRRWSSTGRCGCWPASGHGVFVEVSPHPVLAAAITETLEDAARPRTRRCAGGDRDAAARTTAARTGCWPRWPRCTSGARRWTGRRCWAAGGGWTCRRTRSSGSGTGRGRGGPRLRGRGGAGAGGGGSSAAGRGGGAGRGRGAGAHRAAVGAVAAVAGRPRGGRARCCCRGRRWWSWRCGPGTRPGAGGSRS